MSERTIIINALKGHRLNTMSQDSGNHCICGSDSRFMQIRRVLGTNFPDPPWESMNEHGADMVVNALALPQHPNPKHRKDA